MTGSGAQGQMVAVYRSGRRADLYLYLPARASLDDLPAELMQQFGQPTKALSLWLQADTRLARADAGTVLTALRDKGWYLQLPPGDQSTEALLAALAQRQTPGHGAGDE